MRRIIALLLCICMALSLAACGKRTEPSQAGGQNTLPAADPADGQSADVNRDEMSREDKELIAELIGGQNADGMTDAELDVLVEDLIFNLDSAAVQPPETGDQSAVQPPETGDQSAGQPVVSEDPAAESPAIDTTETSDAYDENGAMTKPFDEVYPELIEEEKVSFSGESILIKLESDTLTEGLKNAGIGALEEIVPLGDAAWYEAELTEGTDPGAALAEVRGLDEVLLAEYNYEIAVAALDEYKSFDGETEAGYRNNDLYQDQWYFHHCGIVDGYGQMATQGGDPSVVVAVIDSGVDYDHEDLKDNMWVNTGEIPDNGIDDDNNGYVDDYYGVDIVAGSGSGDDTNGHGTHVAGIIAARNNNTGVLGIAYNVKIMSVKAAAHNGTLNQADIARAVLYAYENGAEVINMSFGGTACSLAVQDALATAYERCVLVASAGNDAAPNEGLMAIPNYPAALSYVLGVMSVDETGKQSVFSNYDVIPFNGVEYELFASGENIMSTLPNDQYGYLSGTSMAAPVVSAFAAILRSEFTDRDKYPTKFIYGQLASTSGDYADGQVTSSPAQIANLYAALTSLPKPELNVQDYALFDDLEYSDKNNGDGVIDAGETIALGLTLRNRWGMSQNTLVTIDTLSIAGVEDPYITIQNPTVDYGSVGTYSTRDCGKVLTDGELTGWENPFLITVSEDCPNDYRFTLNVTITCENGLDEADTESYTFTGAVDETVRSGCVLPSIIEEDMVLTRDSLYIIPNATVIQPGVTVRVEPGTHIQFWSDDPNDPYAEEGIAYLRVEGNFFVEGTKEDPVYLYPGELKSNFLLDFGAANNGSVHLYYADITNFNLNNVSDTSGVSGITYAYGCTFRQNTGTRMSGRRMTNGTVGTFETYGMSLGTFGLAEKCVFYKVGLTYDGAFLRGTLDTCIFVDCGVDLNKNRGFAATTARNCVFLGNRLTDQNNLNREYTTTMYAMLSNSSPTGTAYYNRFTGTTYVATNDIGVQADFIRDLGGDYAVFQSQEELAWVVSRLGTGCYDLGVAYDVTQGAYVMADGSAVPDFLLEQVPDGYVGALSLQNGKLVAQSGQTLLYEIPGPILPEEITFHRYEICMDPDITLQLTPLSAPVQLSPADFIYESTDEEVLTVDGNGLVTPVGLGTAEVWVYSCDRAVKNYVTIEVGEYVALEGAAFPAETAEVAIGETAALGCVLTPVDTTRITLTYTSSDPTVATVDAAGNVTGVGSGSAVITAVSPELDGDGEAISASMTVTVYNEATSLDFGAVAMSVALGDDAVELPEVLSNDGAELSLSWCSTDETVAVIEEGKLTLAGAGTTTLIVTDLRSGLSASCLVVVSEGAASPVKDVKARDSYHAVLLEDGSLYIWNGSNHKTPTRIAGEVSLISLDPGSSYCYAVSTDGTISKYGITSDNITGETLSTAFAGKNILDFVGHNGNYLAVTGSGTYAWGSNSYGKLGVGVSGTVSELTLVNLDGVVDVETTTYASYFLTSDGKLYAAGQLNGASCLEPVLLTDGVKQIRPETSISGCSYLTTDGQLKYYSRSDGTTSTYLIDLSDMDQVAFYGNPSNAWGIGIQNGRVYTLKASVYSSDPNVIQPVPGVTDAVSVYSSSGQTYYIVTEGGTLLGLGSNDSASNHFPGASAGDVTVPAPILIEPAAGDAVRLTGTNLDPALEVLTSDTLILTFNKALVSAAPELYIEGQRVTVKYAIEDYNQLTVTRGDGFELGTSYELVFPAGSLTAAGGVTNEEEICIKFFRETGPEDPDDPDETGETVIHESQLDESIERIWTTERYLREIQAFIDENGYNSRFYGNAVLNRIFTDTDVSHWMRPVAPIVSSYAEILMGCNWWGTANESLIARQIVDYADMPTYARIMYEPYLTEAPENTFPFVVSVKLFDRNGEEVTTVGNEQVTFRVTFNRDMDTSIPLKVCFGSAYPYGDYTVEGTYVDARTWEGTYTLNTLIENGDQYFSISNGCSAEDDLDLQMDRQRFGFEIDTTAAQALIMQGTATDTGIQLKWTQDDFVTLMGYNVYRSTSEDGLYTRLNKTVVPANTMEWFDDTVEPGVVYYYNFTVVQTDLSESVPSGKIVIMSKDTMAPNIYHSPVTNAFTGSNLVLNATITDNLSIAFANLYYRVAGTESWKTVRMNKLNDKYSAIIPAADVTLAGIEYYIEAFDGASYTCKGSAENPYTVAVQEAIDANSLGDVDGDGVISVKDALLLLYAINDKYNMTAEEFVRADLNGDGVLWAAEALRILQYVNGVVGSVKM